MNIALVTDTYLPDINGVVSSTVILKKALERRGHKVYIITNHAGSHTEMDGDVLRLPGIRLKGLYGYKMSSPYNLAGSKVEEMDLDVIHLQTNFGVGIYGMNLAHSLSIPVVDTYHTMYEDYTHYINPLNSMTFEKVSRDAIRSVSRKVCNMVQAVIAPSEKTREALMAYGVLAPIYVIPTGLDLQKFFHAEDDKERLREIRSQVSDDPEAKILVFVGRLAKEKSLEMLIEAASMNDDPHFHLAIVGAGPDEDYYRSIARDLQATDKVHFLGKAAPDDIAAYYAAFDAFASASLSETQGMTYLEALACGRMVFGRRDEVLDELIDEGQTGYYFDTPQELLEKFAQFSQLTPEEKAEKAALCREKTQPYTDEKFASDMEKAYLQAAEDYAHTFEIKKIRLQNEFVIVDLQREESDQMLSVMISEDEYFEKKLRAHTRIDAYQAAHWASMQNFNYASYRCRRYLEHRDATKAMMERYITDRLKVDASTARQVAADLEERGLIDDRRYALDKADYYQSSGYSRRQIEQKLYKAGLAPELIEEAVGRLQTSLEKHNALLLAKRLVKTLKSQSVRRQRQMIVDKLLHRGFSLDAAQEAAQALELDESQDEQALYTAVKKAGRLYASRPEEEQKRKIRQYCLRQGFDLDRVDAVMESEWTDEDL